MGNKAKSQEQKIADKARVKQKLEEKAKELYLLELGKKARKEKSKSSRTICEEVMADHKRTTGQDVAISHVTITRRVNNMPSRADANRATKSWLTIEETEAVIEYIVEIGAQGFPLSHKRLKEHVDELCQARLGNEFPETGVGKKWTHRFIVKHSDRKMVSWSTQLKEKRGRGVNPHTKEAWDNLLASTVETYKIKPENLYGSDETGVTGTTGTHERVIGKRKKGLHYQQVGDSQENTMVIVSICADGSALPPAVIFKGQAYQTTWNENNPTKAL
jgi:hypothetical protein